MTVVLAFPEALPMSRLCRFDAPVCSCIIEPVVKFAYCTSATPDHNATATDSRSWFVFISHPFDRTRAVDLRRELRITHVTDLASARDPYLELLARHHFHIASSPWIEMLPGT